MSDDGRYHEVVVRSRGLFEQLGVHPEAITAGRLAQVVYTLLEAMHASEKRRREASPDDRCANWPAILTNNK